MLEGWEMVDENCAKLQAVGNQGTPRQCSYPLLKGKNGKTICVKCDDLRQQLGTAATEEKTNSNAETDVSDNPIMGPVEFKDFEKRRDQTSAEIGKKLLQGWAMLDEVCSGNNGKCLTPLMKNPSDGTTVCAACNQIPSKAPANKPVQQNVQSNTIEEIPKKKDQTSSSRLQLGASSNSMEMTSFDALMRPSRSDDASDLIGQHLLKGWTLLADMCSGSRCATPLMRDQQQQVWCLKCNKIIQKPQERSQPKAEAQDSNSMASSSAKLEGLQKQNSPPTPATVQRAGSGAKRKPDWEETLNETANCLLEDLSQTQNLIRKSTCIQEKTQLAKLIQEYAKALKALQEVNDS